MPAGIEAGIESARRGTGEPLCDASRAFFEPRFGQDFRHVRLHADEWAAQSARQLGARAYTLGRDIVFGAGQYAPETDWGKRLLAHELTHIVQQGGAAPSTAAQRSLVRERTSSPRIQGAWTFTGEVTNPQPIIGSPITRGDGSYVALPLAHGVFGSVRAEQVGWGRWTIKGGNAHLVMRRDTRYTFEHTGTDNNLLTLRGDANLSGGAEADDLHYAQAAAAVAGNIAVRTAANLTPAPTSLFPTIEDAGRSEAEESTVADVDVSLPVGDATVDFQIPLKKTDEGELAPLGDSTPVNRDVSGGGEWKRVDVYLVAYIEATADIEGAIVWDVAGDVNWAKVMARYNLKWEERPVPGGAPSACHHC